MIADLLSDPEEIDCSFRSVLFTLVGHVVEVMFGHKDIEVTDVQGVLTVMGVIRRRLEIFERWKDNGYHSEDWDDNTGEW